MIKKRGKEIYQPPYAQDLSGFSANGQQQPAGMCKDGSSLTFQTCAGGSAPLGGECSPTGVSPEFGYCSLGGSAVEGCTSGGVHT